jgi:hypothetical protein
MTCQHHQPVDHWTWYRSRSRDKALPTAELAALERSGHEFVPILNPWQRPTGQYVLIAPDGCEVVR